MEDEFDLIAHNCALEPCMGRLLDTSQSFTL